MVDHESTTLLFNQESDGSFESLKPSRWRARSLSRFLSKKICKNLLTCVKNRIPDATIPPRKGEVNFTMVTTHFHPVVPVSDHVPGYILIMNSTYSEPDLTLPKTFQNPHAAHRDIFIRHTHTLTQKALSQNAPYKWQSKLRVILCQDESSLGSCNRPAEWIWGGGSREGIKEYHRRWKLFQLNLFFGERGKPINSSSI